MKSEFGKGIVYPLGLYAMHLGRIEKANTYLEFVLAIEGAYDHLRELNTNILPKSIAKDINYLINRLNKYKCSWKLNIVKVPKDRLRIVNQSKKIFFDIDKLLLKAKPIKGECE